jgi:hypothetical protein
VVAQIESAVWHYRPAREVRNRRLAVQRVGAMNYEARIDRVLAGITRRDRRSQNWRRARIAATARHHPSVGRRRQDLDLTRLA